MVFNAAHNPDEAWYARNDTTIHEAFEDRTPAFHNIIALDSALDAALDAALDVHPQLYKSMDHVFRHTCHLSKILYKSYRLFHPGMVSLYVKSTVLLAPNMAIAKLKCRPLLSMSRLAMEAGLANLTLSC